MKKCQVYAGRKISFEPEEVTQMKAFDASGMQFFYVVTMQFVKNCYIYTFLNAKHQVLLFSLDSRTKISQIICLLA